MTQEAIKALSDSELPQVIIWAQEEIKSRTERRRQEAIARIKTLAAENHISVAIGGVRGRPARIKPPEKSDKQVKTA